MIAEFRSCGLCGRADIPRGIEWEWWIDGKPHHAECAMQILEDRRDARAIAEAYLTHNPEANPLLVLNVIGFVQGWLARRRAKAGS